MKASRRISLGYLSRVDHSGARRYQRVGRGHSAVYLSLGKLFCIVLFCWSPEGCTLTLAASLKLEARVQRLCRAPECLVSCWVPHPIVCLREEEASSLTQPVCLAPACTLRGGKRRGERGERGAFIPPPLAQVDPRDEIGCQARASSSKRIISGEGPTCSKARSPFSAPDGQASPPAQEVYH